MKKLIFCLICAVMMSISIGGTIAYFSVSTDQSVLFLKNEIEIKQVTIQRDESFDIVGNVGEQDYDYYLLISVNLIKCCH